jgi:ELWxxDGT repeat protein
MLHRLRLCVLIALLPLLLVARPGRAQTPEPGSAYLVKDISLSSEPVQNEPYDMVPVGDLMFFFYNDGTHGQELWRTDGTPERTWMVKDICRGFGASTLIRINMTIVPASPLAPTSAGSSSSLPTKRAMARSSG